MKTYMPWCSEKTIEQEASTLDSAVTTGGRPEPLGGPCRQDVSCAEAIW
jgi:hypothetical protein